MQAKQILIADDDPSLVHALSLILSSLGSVDSCTGLRDFQARNQATKGWDLVLLDYQLADCTGFQLLEQLMPNSSHTGSPPLVLLMTAVLNKDIAKQGYDHRIGGIIEKPFEYKDLKSMLQSRGWFNKASAKPAWYFDEDRRLLFGDNQTWELTDTEFKILKAIGTNGVVVSKKRIEASIWGESVTSKNVFDSHFYNLKKKIPALKDKIQVVRGRGYRWSD